METNQLHLEPIISPEPVAFWPLQPGWYVVLILLLALLGYFSYRYFRWRKRNSYRRLAQTSLESMGIPTTLGDVARLNTIVKATALQGFPRTQVAGLYGREWIEFLDKTAPGCNFNTKGTVLASASFSKAQHAAIPKEEAEALWIMIGQWIKKHRSTT